MLKNYIKIAFKVMLRQKFFTAVSLFGISFTVMIFSITAGLLQLMVGNNPPAVNHNRTLYFAGVSLLNKDGNHYGQSPETYWPAVEKVKNIELIAKYYTRSTSAFKNGRVTLFPTAYTEAAFWRIYAYEFIEGKPFTNQDVATGQAYAVITESVKKYYFGDRTAVGKTIGEDPKWTVKGVVKDGVSILGNEAESATIWVPVQGRANEIEYAIMLARHENDIPGITANMNTQAQKAYKTGKENVKVYLRTIYEIAGFYRLIKVLGGLFFLVLAIPAVNIMGLNITRIAERSEEIGIRKAFGATSGALVVQFIIENILITLIGGTLGILFTLAGSQGIIQIIYYKNPEMATATGNIFLNWAVIGYSLCGILFFGLLSGIGPAWKMSRIHAVQALKGGQL